MKALYHYTCIEHLPEILESGFLKLTESNISAKTEGLHPVVWLTSDEHAENDPSGYGLNHSTVNKTEIRIAVPLRPFYKKWKEWAMKRNIDKRLMQALKSTGKRSQSWYVSETKIPIEEFLEIRNTKTNEVIFSK